MREKRNHKICYVILTCDENQHRRRAIEQTWGKDVRHDIVWLTDDMSPKVKGYESCPHKYVTFFKNLSRKPKYDWYVFVDDDTYVHVSGINNIVSEQENDCSQVVGLMIGSGYEDSRNDHLYKQPTSDALAEGAKLTAYPCKWVYITGPKAPPGGWFLDCYGMYSTSTASYSADFVFPHGGAGIIMNKNSVDDVSRYVSTTAEVPLSLHSDVSLAVWLAKSSDAKLRDDVRLFNGFRSLNDEINSIKRGNTVTCHYVTAPDMMSLYNALNDNNCHMFSWLKKQIKKFLNASVKLLFGLKL